MLDDAARHPQSQPIKTHSAIGITLLFFAGWFGYGVFSVHPGFVHEDLAEISMWAGLGFHWGYDKHPPLLPWIVGVMGLVLPITWVTLAALAAANLTVAALAVWRIGVMTLGAERAVLAVGLFCLSPYTTSQAIKLNHNSILLALWPLSVLAFLRAVERPTVARGAVLGLACAAAVLAKYSSGLLFLGIGVAAVAHERRWVMLASPAPYVAVVVFGIVIAPHLDWMLADHFSTVTHAVQRLSPVGAVPWKMLQANLLGVLPMLLGLFVLIMCFGKRTHRDARASGNDDAMLQAVFIVTAISYAATIALIMGLGLRASHTWTLQLYAFVPVLLASLIGQPSLTAKAALVRAAIGVVGCLPLVGVAAQAVSFQINASRAVDPQTEFAADGLAVWRRAVGRPLLFVAGDHRYAMAASLTATDRPAAWSHYGRAWWVNEQKIADHGLLAWCRDGDVPCERNSQRFLHQGKGWSCRLVRQRDAWGAKGPAVVATLFVVPPHGAMTADRTGERCKIE